MEMIRLTERIWYYPYEEERDRPILGYIRGDRFSLAVDAGHSAEHTLQFYRALGEAGLPLPDITVLTHWHWDHTFGMHAVRGLCLANQLTDRHLETFREKIRSEGTEMFFSMHDSIRREYASGQPVKVTLSDMAFLGEMNLELGSCPVKLFQAEAPHTDDSTLIFVPGEKTLFLGDAAGGVFPSWEKDPALCKKLADTLAHIDADVMLESHAEPATKREMIEDLLSDL